MIREAIETDYEWIYKLGELLHVNFRNTYNLNELANKNYFKILVYESEGKILGFLMYTVLEECIDILDIVVDSKYRNQKIATNLMDYMITNAPLKCKIYLEVSVDNQAALNLYKKFGFITIHTRKKYYGDKDAYVMERVIENE